jgi:Escherichia/Staphylococcus phage prohead protease
MSDTTTDDQTPAEDERPRAPIEFRAAPGDVLVNFAERIIEHVVVPYNFDGVAEWPPHSGRMVLETVLPGAFDGVERRANRIKVNRDHDFARSVGRAFALHPSRTEGLVAETRISRTPLGDETLQLVEDGVLEPSVGMAVMPSWHELVENRSRRRIHKAFLDHIGWVPNPGYEGGVPVLDIRSALPPPPPPIVVATPNLDEVLAWINTPTR